MGYRELIDELISNPEKLIIKKPFTRGAERDGYDSGRSIRMGETRSAELPRRRYKVISQEQYMNELDPECHDVLFDDNIPSICVKVSDGDYREIRHRRTAIPIQKVIKNKQVMHLANNPMLFTMMETDPTEAQRLNFITFKQYWNLRNQDGMKVKMVDAQKSFGDAGLLFYFDHNNHIKSRLLSYSDGYILCPHNDDNGDRILESVYYRSGNTEYIDSYDDTFSYRWAKAEDETTENAKWEFLGKEKHGFSEIQLVTKRGKVAWDAVQPIIEVYEELYNVFNAIQKRFGWGILYIKGQFSEKAKKIAGSVILNDNSVEGKGDAKFLTPPTPQGMIDTLNLLLESIQLGSSTTFLLPKDIKTGGEIAGITVKLVQSLDMENALQECVEWQNVADKMVRLFKEGLAKELVNERINPNAITEFKQLNINAKFKVWEPQSDSEYNQMLIQLAGAGLISNETGIELNTASKPDEKARVQKQIEDAAKLNIQTNFVNNGGGDGLG